MITAPWACLGKACVNAVQKDRAVVLEAPFSPKSVFAQYHGFAKYTVCRISCDKPDLRITKSSGGKARANAFKQKFVVPVPKTALETHPESPPEDPKVQQLRLWLKTLEWEDCNLSVVRYPFGSKAPGCGAVAGANGVPKGATIVKVPRRALMTEQTAADCPSVGPVISKGELSPWQGMCLHLLYERALGSRSFWRSYIAVLPGVLDLAQEHPLFWPERTRREWLEGSPLLARIERRLEQCRLDYQALVEAGANKLVPPGKKGSPGVVTELSVTWAAAILLSRAFSLDLSSDSHWEEGEPSIALVPWADMLNHSSAAGQESCLTFDSHTGYATLQAHRDYSPGEQVYDSYGPNLTTGQLLLDYGFVDEENRIHSVDLPASLLGPPRGASNAALLEAVGLPIDGAVFSLLPAGVDASVLAWTRASVASYDELVKAGWGHQRGELEWASTAMAKLSRPVSRGNEAEVLRRLQRACEGLLVQYPTTLEEDQAALEAFDRPGGPMAVPLPWARQQAVKATISEKLALRGAYEWILQKMLALERGASLELLYAKK